MTPERVNSLAAQIRFDYALSRGAFEAIIAALFQACAEQREEDAKICRAQGDKEGDDYEAGGCYGCETAIRGQT